MKAESGKVITEHQVETIGEVAADQLGDRSTFHIFNKKSELIWLLAADGSEFLLQQLDVFCTDGDCKGEVIPSTEGKRPRYRHWVLGNSANKFYAPFDSKDGALQFAVERKGMKVL